MVSLAEQGGGNFRDYREQARILYERPSRVDPEAPMSQTMSKPRPGRVEPIRKRPPRKWPFPLNLYQTAVGKKWVMALSGIALLGFVLVHMIGNLHIYQGSTEINVYAESLRDLGGHLIPRTLLLWVLRLGLTGAFVLHIHSAYGLTRMNRAANVGYKSDRDYVAANFASRTMRWTGIIVGLFVLFHLADLTWGWWLGDTYIKGDVYWNVTHSLKNVPVAIVYILANVALAVHLYHGAWSMFQSLGINSPVINKVRRGFATGFALLILAGNLSFPIMVQAGVIGKQDTPTATHSAADQNSESTR
jgi:succinate dehydrogenase / fumarate reductase cytochrome b subunit